MITVGDRRRKDIGDLSDMKQSIANIGLLHPIVIDENAVLICGQRRLLACQELGWIEIDTTVINIENAMQGELDENVVRKDFTPSEAVAIWEALDKRKTTPNKSLCLNKTEVEPPRRERAGLLLFGRAGTHLKQEEREMRVLLVLIICAILLGCASNQPDEVIQNPNSSLCEERGHIRGLIFSVTLLGWQPYIIEYPDSTVRVHHNPNIKTYHCERCGIEIKVPVQENPYRELIWDSKSGLNP